MIEIVVEFDAEIQEYVQGELEKTCIRLDHCHQCLAVGKMIGHGYYDRQPQDCKKSWTIRIKRWRCKACGKTVSVLPSFLLRYRHYLLDVIAKVLALRFEQQASWAKAMSGGTPEEFPTKRTRQRWCEAYSVQARRWLGAVQSALATQDSLSAWLDAHGESPQAQSAEQALLVASEHLLSWAKTRWAQQLASYGLGKRMQFLWFWGAGQGLGRLV